VDFDLDDDQQAIADLAGTILADRCAPDRLREHEASGAPFAADAWSELAKADLLGVALPEAVGGGGYGALEAALIAEQVGRHVAPVPFAETMAAAMVLAQLRGADHAELLGAVISGDAVLTVALDEPAVDPSGGPATVAAPDGDAWVLTGTKSPVRWASEAAATVVTATTDDGDGVFVVVAGADGATITGEEAMWGLPVATVELAGTPAVRLGGPGAADQLRRLATALSCATVSGVCEGALRITAAYVSEREQFGTKIGTFQAVGQRMADAYIDTEAIRLTTRQGAWRLSRGLPVDDELHIAKFWAADGAHRVVHAAQHLHGGVGLDLDFPIHRYFRWAKVLELQLGNGTDHLRALGAAIAASPA
jgi:alkylation response protein AidB-like acyl-CoA dehydrogenase